MIMAINLKLELGLMLWWQTSMH